ncbi:3'-5' exonuclease-like [Typha angustifolia]|uniref:3'-5' exonuclease-like n=1 Tax=Typha angustifolia TaxID=59011 RepID=UPI003C2DCD83
MSMNVDQQTDTLFNVNLHGIHDILTTVTFTGADVESWLREVLHVHRRHLRNLIVGLDCEWRPNRRPGESNPVAILQLCIGRRCLLFSLVHADSIPGALLNFLADPQFTFVGVGIDGDVEKLLHDWELSVSNAIDLRDLAADKTGRQEMKHKGLAGIAEVVMGFVPKKAKRVTMSDWARQYLTLEQIGYACADAFLSFEIGRRLLSDQF